MLKLEFSTSNAAFAGVNGQSEAAHIVRAISELKCVREEPSWMRVETLEG